MNPSSPSQLDPAPANGGRGQTDASVVLPASAVLPQAFELTMVDPALLPRQGLAIENSPRRVAFQAALKDFLEVLVLEDIAAPHLLPNHADKVRNHFGSMFQVTLRGLLLSGDQSACSALLLDNSRSVATLLPRLLAGLAVDDSKSDGAARIYRLGRSYAGEIWHWSGEVAAEVSSESAEAEIAVFPHILTLLRDNVLVYCHVERPQGDALADYIESIWGLPGEELLDDLKRAERALQATWEQVPEWVQAELGLACGDSDGLFAAPRGLMTRFAEIGGEGAPNGAEAAVWETLKLRLLQFDLLAQTRRRIITVDRDKASWVESDETGGGARFSLDIRPMQLFAARGSGATVQRFGLRYDISNFSTTMASLEVMPAADREAALKQFFFFQRRVRNTARRRGLQLEKHFGDGILFSSAQSARDVLAAAIEIQRAYRHAVDRGMAFAGGIRLAANWGAYRVLAGPRDSARGDGTDGQLFGPGIVEISRLVSGKVNRDLSEIKKLLIGAGYRQEEVHRFFARFEQRHIQLVDDATESRRFWAYVNPNGTLVNEGIVITASFLARLLAVVDSARGRHREGTREFVLLNLASSGEQPLIAGITHRGFAEFKGLAPIEVFEVVDGQEWEQVLETAAPVEIDDSGFTWLPEPIAG